jgi:hypothetical protein
MPKQIPLFVFAAVISWSTAILFAQEQALAPSLKEGDTWQFNISRKGQSVSSTDRNEGIYELSVTQGAVKLYAIDGGQRSDIPIQPDGPTQVLLRLVGKSDQRADLKSRCQWVKGGVTSTKLTSLVYLGPDGGMSRLLLLG